MTHAHLDRRFKKQCEKEISLLVPTAKLFVFLISLVLTSASASAATPIIVADGLDGPNTITLDGNDIYFADDTVNNGTLKKIGKKGGAITTFATNTALYDSGSYRGISSIDFDVNNVYAGYGGYVSYNIMSVPKSGGVSNILASPTGGYLIGVIGQSIYYGSGFCCIKKKPVNGGMAETVLTDNWVRSAAVDNTAIYFIEYYSRDILKFDATNNTLTTLIDRNSSSAEGGIFIDSNNVYLNIGSTGEIIKISKTGGPVTTILSIGSSATAFASDGDFVYFVENSDLKKVSVNGGTPTLLAQGVSASSMTVDDFSVYWTDPSGGQGAGKIFKINEQIVVTIDIKPDSDPNCFNNNGHGVIPVAILGSTGFDTTTIDPGTVTLEGMAIKAVGKSNKLLAHYEDTNADGYTDLVIQIEDNDGVFTEGSTTATLTGNLLSEYGGTPIEGSDSICVVP